MTDNLRIYNIDALISDAAAKVRVNQETGEIEGADELEALLTQGEEKVLNCGRYLATRSRALDAMKEHIKDIQTRIKAEERRQTYLKSMMLRAIKALNTTDLEAPDIAVSLRKLPPSVFIENEELIPSKYFNLKQDLILDKRAVLAELKAGKEVKGCSLSRGFKLEIK